MRCWSGRRRSPANGKYTYVEYARYADDLVILVDGYPRHDWLLKAVDRRLREELAKLDLRLNEEKSRIVDLSKGEASGSWASTSGASARCGGAWRPQYTPKLKKRTALLRKLKEIFRRCRVPAGGAGDRGDQPDPAGLGELLPDRALEPVLRLS